MKLFAFLLVALTSAVAASAPAEDPDCDVGPYLDIGYASKNGSVCSKASGFSFLPTLLVVPPNAKEMEIVCKNAACQSVFADLNKAYPTECIVIFGLGVRKTLLDPVAAACPVVTTAPPPSPTTSAPALNGPCGNEQVGAQACPGNQYCQPWNPTQYQCHSIDEKCGVQEVGVDYYGDDIAKFQLLLPEQCCEKCAATTGCKAYTFVNYNPDGKAYCYLKKGTGQKVNKVGVVSATIVSSPVTCTTPAWGNCGNAAAGFSCCPSGFYCQPWGSNYYQCIQPPAKCSQQFPNTDFYGDDLATVYGIGPGECCEKCAATAGCKAYTYVNDNVPTPACYLKKGMGVKQPNARAVSGLVN